MCLFLFLSGLCVVSFSFDYAQYGGAIQNKDGVLTFEGSATFTSCSAEASSSSSSGELYVVSGSDELSVEA